jgi:hypothetical protein
MSAHSSQTASGITPRRISRPKILHPKHRSESWRDHVLRRPPQRAECGTRRDSCPEPVHEWQQQPVTGSEENCQHHHEDRAGNDPRGLLVDRVRGSERHTNSSKSIQLL